MESVGIELFI